MTLDLKKTAAFGAAFGVAAVLTLAALFWVVTRPKGWDTGSVKANSLAVSQTLADVPANSTTGEPEYFEGAGFSLKIVLENKARTDYTFPEDFKLFSRNDRSSALSEVKITIDHPYVIPAKERAEVDVRMEWSCTDEETATGKKSERPAQDCFNDVFGHTSGLVGFDYGTHTRIDIPKPTFLGGIPAGPLSGGPWTVYQETPVNGRTKNQRK